MCPSRIHLVNERLKDEALCQESYRPDSPIHCGPIHCGAVNPHRAYSCAARQSP